ncbi:MAG: stage V sporulation protein AA [Lachnospiraceae bacterium]|nr:stage V sporulation protein AA [Lachnospiraceae bacterium]
MNDTLYIKVPACIEITNPNVQFSDFLTIYCKNKKIENDIKSMHFFTFDKEGQIVVSILKIIEMIQEKYPDIEVSNLGEEDFIIEYSKEKRHASLKEFLSTIFICLVAFFGGGYAIMAYNTDVGAKELFVYLSMLFLGNAKQGVILLSIFYAIGLTLGIILFFNHIGNKKLTGDPTPLEIQMRLYEQDISTTIIKDVSRKQESIDVK